MSLVKPLLTCQETGLYFGYPECCVVAFVNNKKKLEKKEVLFLVCLVVD